MAKYGNLFYIQKLHICLLKSLQRTLKLREKPQSNRELVKHEISKFFPFLEGQFWSAGSGSEFRSGYATNPFRSRSNRAPKHWVLRKGTRNELLSPWLKWSSLRRGFILCNNHTGPAFLGRNILVICSLESAVNICVLHSMYGNQAVRYLLSMGWGCLAVRASRRAARRKGFSRWREKVPAGAPLKHKSMNYGATLADRRRNFKNPPFTEKKNCLEMEFLVKSFAPCYSVFPPADF